MQSQLIDKTKQDIRRCFNKAALTYDNHNVMQQQTGTALITLLQKHCHQPQKIIDLGCGSGSVTEHLARQFKYELFHALDISEQLLFKARERLFAYSVDVYEGDFDYLREPNILFDLAFSNMALQWSSSLGKTLASIHNNLASGGILAFSMPLHGTFAELNQFAKNNFYEADTVIAMLAKNHFVTLEYSVEPVSFSFDSLYSALKTLKAVGANHVFNKPHNALRGRSFLHDLTQADENFVFTYVTGYFIARKK
jgi:malonyl-CoA O-methyltransferase